MLIVNKIYGHYQNQEISKEEAVSRLLAEIFKSPRYYCMETLPEDEISNFLIWIHNHIPKILENYKSSCTSFLTYYTSSVRLRYKSWKRLNIKNKHFQDILDNHHYLEYAEQGETEVILREKQPEYTPASDSVILKEPLSKKQATTLLVLSLKSYHLLTNKVIETIPILAGIPAHDFHKYIKLIEEKMSDKLDIFKKLENRINMSYIRCQQYALELSQMTSECCQYDIVLRRYENQKKKLKQLRQRHKEFNLRPSNKIVEEVLNLPEGSIRRIMAKADKSVDQIRNLLDPQNQ